MNEVSRRIELLETIRKEVVSLLDAEGLPCGDVSLDEATSLIDDLGFGSMMLLDLAMGIERALGCRFENVEGWTERSLAQDGGRLLLAGVVDACLEATARSEAR